MKVKVKKVKHNFAKEPEDVRMTLSQFSKKAWVLWSKGNPANDEILNEEKRLKQCSSDIDISLLNRSSEWANFVESMDTDSGLIGPITFESFFDENSDFAVNEIGTFIFSGGFDRFIFIEKTLKCMWHFQTVSNNEIILENEFKEIYVCHDWKTFCTTVLPGVYTMYNLADTNVNSEFRLDTKSDKNAGESVELCKNKLIQEDVSKNDGEDSQTEESVAVTRSFWQKLSNLKKCLFKFSPNSAYIIGGTLFRVPQFHHDKDRMFFVQYDGLRHSLKFLVPSKIVDLHGDPIDKIEIDIKEKGNQYFIEMTGISIYPGSILNVDKSPRTVVAPIEVRFSLRDFFNKFTNDHISFKYYHSFTPGCYKFDFDGKETCCNNPVFSDQLYGGTIFEKVSLLKSYMMRSFFVKRYTTDNGDTCISFYFIIGISLPNNNLEEISIKFNEHRMIHANSGDTTMKMMMDQNMVFYENDLNEFIKDKTFFIL